MRAKEQPRKRHRHGHPQGPDRHAALVRDALVRLLQLAEQRADLRQIGPAGVRQHDRSRRAREQRGAELFLQRIHQSRQR